LAGGPVGKVRDGDLIEITIDRRNLTGSLNFIGSADSVLSPEEGAAVLSQRTPAVPLQADKDLPDDTRLWAALQQASGGTWGGCVYDPDRISELLRKAQFS
jgi:dihydroxyacid dehydratase/phosphogluconate dehydratase